MVLNQLLTLSIFILGLVTVILSIVVSAKFQKYKKYLTGAPRELSSAVSWQLAGEAIIGAGTLIFATAAFFGVLDDWSVLTQSVIRFFMFFATSVTTIHLHRTLTQLSDHR